MISSSFPLQTDFGFRSLGYLEVPETGMYRFGTQSPGGAELAVYDTTEHDLGRTVVSADGAWWPTTLDEEYQATTHRWHFENEYVRSDTRDCGTQVCRTSYYTYEDDDPTWYQVERRDARWLLDDLRASGPAGDVVRWGHEMELEAGRQYPLAFTGWVGALGGDIGIHVDGPGQAPQPLPFEWISAAGDDVVGFDRGFDTSDSAPIGGVDAAISGHGDGLAVLGANGVLDFYDTDGGIGWTPSGSVPDVALRPPPVMHPASGGTGVAFDDAGSTVAVVVDQWPDADREDFEPVHHTAELVLGLEDLFGAPPGAGSGPFTVYSDGVIVVLEEPFWVDVTLFRRPTWPTVRLEVDELVAYVDETGEIIDGSIAGFVHDGDESWPLSELVSGRIDDDELVIDEISSELQGVGHRTYGFQLGFLDSTAPPSDDLPDSLDIAIVDRVDVNAPWSEGNARVSFLNDMLGGHPDPELIPDRAVYQSVDVSPDGNTIVVSQPAGDHQRIVVVGRNHRGASWGIVGVFSADSGPAALGGRGRRAAHRVRQRRSGGAPHLDPGPRVVGPGGARDRRRRRCAGARLLRPAPGDRRVRLGHGDRAAALAVRRHMERAAPPRRPGNLRPRHRLLVGSADRHRRRWSRPGLPRHRVPAVEQLRRLVAGAGHRRRAARRLGGGQLAAGPARRDPRVVTGRVRCVDDARRLSDASADRHVGWSVGQ